MPRITGFFLTILLPSLLAIVQLPAEAAPPGSGTGLTIEGQTCQPDGTISGALTWTPSGTGAQYVDLAIDAGFSNYGRGGPYESAVREVTLAPLMPGRTYYVRVLTISGGQTLASDVLTVNTSPCVAPTSATVTLSSVHSGKCLEVYGFSQSNSASIAQWACSGGANQTLQAIPQPDGYYELRFAHSGKCLEVLGWDLRNGAALGQYTCHGGANQRWTGNFSHGSVSVIGNKFTQKCIDVYGWSRRNGDPIAQWDCHSGNNQQWRVNAGRPAPGGAPVIALTIDTDSVRGYAPQILDTLDAYGVKASFGVTGHWAVTNPDLLRRLVASGHTIMNHSWNHPSFTAISSAQRFEELRATDDAIISIAGVSTKPYFRPPYGDTNASVAGDAATAGYRVILWTIDPQGWRGYSGDVITNYILARATNGAVVLMHSTVAGDLAALGPTIQGLRARGFQFVTIAQLYP